MGKEKNSLMIYIREFIISNLVLLPVSHLRMPCTGITIETHSLFPVRYNSLLERPLLLYSSVRRGSFDWRFCLPYGYRSVQQTKISVRKISCCFGYPLFLLSCSTTIIYLFTIKSQYFFILFLLNGNSR